MIKTIMLRLITVVMLILCIMLCGCGGRGGDTAVSSSPPQSNASTKQDITSNPAVYFDEERAAKKDNIIIAECLLAEERDGRAVFTFWPVYEFVGTLKYDYFDREIKVVGRPEDYSFTNTYAPSNAYILYLTYDEEEKVYIDFLCNGNVTELSDFDDVYEPRTDMLLNINKSNVQYVYDIIARYNGS